MRLSHTRHVENPEGRRTPKISFVTQSMLSFVFACRAHVVIDLTDDFRCSGAEQG